MNSFPYAENQHKRYHSWNYALRQEFGEKIFKVPIDAGFDCPNRDGTVAKGGCTFCSVSGSGDMIVAPEAPLPVQFHKEIDVMHKNGLMSISTSFISKISPIPMPQLQSFESGLNKF